MQVRSLFFLSILLFFTGFIHAMEAPDICAPDANGLITGILVNLPSDFKSQLLQNMALNIINLLKANKRKGLKDDQKVVPIGCKNFRLPEINIDGTCSFNAIFQIVAAALSNYPLGYNELNATNIQSQLLKQELERFRYAQENNENKFFSIEKQAIYKNAIKDVLHWSDGVRGLRKNNGDKFFVDLTLELSHARYPNISSRADREFLDAVEIKKLHREFLENEIRILGGAELDQAPILFLNLAKDRSVSKKPLIFPYLDIAAKNKTQKYKLVGICQIHKDSFPPLLKLIMQYIFLTKVHQSNFPTWGTHIDAYVNYNDHWYLMDDENRWKVSAYEINGNKNIISKSKHSDLILHALCNAYPGYPRILMYVPIDGDVSEEAFDDEKEYGIRLTRETEKPSLLSSGALIIGASLYNGFYWGLHENLVSFYKGQKLSCEFGLYSAIGTLIYSFFWIKPKYSSTLTYKPADRLTNFGPQQNINHFVNIGNGIC